MHVSTTTRAQRSCATTHRAHAPAVTLQLVFGPCDAMAPLLRALADALEPVALVPTELRPSIGPDGCRLRVTCDLDPSRPDLARVLAHLLRRQDAGRAGALGAQRVTGLHGGEGPPAPR